MRYEGFLQREFSRALCDLSMLQADRRARLAEAESEAKTEAETAAATHAEAAETEPNQADSPAANPKAENAKRSQFPEPGALPNVGIAPNPRQNPNPDPSPAESEAA